MRGRDLAFGIMVGLMMLLGAFSMLVGLDGPCPASKALPAVQEPNPLAIDQNGQVIPGLQDFFYAPAITLPSVDLDLAEVVDMLVDYDIVHVNRLMSFLHYYGLTDPRTHTIYINTDVSMSETRDTIIHELLHVVYFRRGVDTSGPYEPFIGARAHEIYLKLYGFPAPQAPQVAK